MYIAKPWLWPPPPQSPSSWEARCLIVQLTGWHPPSLHLVPVHPKKNKIAEVYDDGERERERKRDRKKPNEYGFSNHPLPSNHSFRLLSISFHQPLLSKMPSKAVGAAKYLSNHYLYPCHSSLCHLIRVIPVFQFSHLQKKSLYCFFFVWIIKCFFFCYLSLHVHNPIAHQPQPQPQPPLPPPLHRVCRSMNSLRVYRYVPEFLAAG